MPLRRPAGSLFRKLQDGQLTGKWPASLGALPKQFCARIDTENVRESLKRPGLGSLLLQLEQRLSRRQPQLSREDVHELQKMVTRIGTRVCESVQQRHMFLTCQGDVLLLQLLLQLVPPNAGSIEPLIPIINEAIQILAELAISDPHQAEALSTNRALIALLFRLMGEKQTVDAALTLAQELLAVGPDIFPLSAVPQLPQLLASLSPRGLSLVGRALAVLLAKAAEQTMDGVPAPECVAPELCASCANNQMLLAIPSLLSRIIKLLKLRAPPPGLWSHMLAQLPNAQPMLHHWHEEREHDWAQLGESRAPSQHVVVLLSADQVPPALRELVTTTPQPAAPNAPPMPAFPQLPAFAHEGQESLHLSSLQTALWCTLQADLLYVLWALMGGKTKAEAQQRLVGLGLLDVLRSMFDRLDWRPPPTAHHVQHGAGCTCSPQSCLQMQLLRTLQVLCEKESDQPSYHRLLLQARPTPAANGPAAAPAAAEASAASPASADAASTGLATAELALATHASDSGGGSSSSGVGEGEGSSSGAGSSSSGAGSSGADADAAGGASSSGEGLLFAIMRLLLLQPTDSVYLLGLASCVHKWVQASSAAEQKLVADFPGFIEFVLHQLLCDPTPPEPQLQVFFDLLAELLKFNPPLLLEVQRELVRGPDGAARTAAFTERLSSHIVDASIFVQCVALTLNSSTSPRRGCKALADLGLPCTPPHAAAHADPHADPHADAHAGTPPDAAPAAKAAAAAADATDATAVSSASTAAAATAPSAADAAAATAEDAAAAGAALVEGCDAQAGVESGAAAGSGASATAADASASAAEGASSGAAGDARATECVVVTSTTLTAAFAGIGVPRHTLAGGEPCEGGEGGEGAATAREREIGAIDPALQTLLTTPLPPPPPADASVLDEAAGGEIARYIVEHEVELTLRLMGTVQVSEVSVETMCVINAAIVFFLIAQRRGERLALTANVLRAAAADDATLVPIRSFLKLLGFWGDVYHSHSCERRFLEFSSGVPFEHWLALVEGLKTDLQRALDAIPPLPRA